MPLNLPNTTEEIGADLRQWTGCHGCLGVYLMSYQLLPYERTTELLTDLFGASPREGTLYRAQQSAASQLQPVEEAIRKSLQQAEVAHFDETGLYIGGKRHWLHGASTPQLTLYQAHSKRGKQGTDAMGVLPNFGGVAVHDGYSSFRVYECEHSLCNAHHLRELTALEEQRQEWTKQMKQLLVQIKDAVDGACGEGQECLGEGEGSLRGAIGNWWRRGWRETRPIHIHHRGSRGMDGARTGKAEQSLQPVGAVEGS